jgi:hypothetical protein
MKQGATWSPERLSVTPRFSGPASHLEKSTETPCARLYIRNLTRERDELTEKLYSAASQLLAAQKERDMGRHS